MTLNSINTGQSSPTANIAVNRNRIKHYSNRVYLKSGTHYEIELFNPTHNKVVAKISIDGVAISDSGIIVKPGQRIFLERWIDTPKKFLFETYGVEKSNESLNAISQNGKIKVDFYNESRITSTSTFYGWPYSTLSTDISSNLLIGNGTTTWVGQTFPTYGGTTVNTQVSYTSSTNDSQASASIETGRTEKGENSNQTMSQEFSQWDSWPSTSVTLVIMPDSNVALESHEIRNYCTNCGARNKKSSWKFCPSCGTKI